MTTSTTTWSSTELLSHTQWVRALALILVRDAEHADDLAQETLLAALEKRPLSDRSLRPWLARVLRNRTALWRRGEARRAARERARASEEALPSSDELLEQAELQGAIVAALAKLREPYRSVLLLRFYEGLAPSEIARRRDVPAATVRSQLHRGLETLRGELDERYGNDRRRWALAAVPFATRATDGAGVAGASGVAYKAAAVLIVVAGSVALGRWALRSTDGRPDTASLAGVTVAEAAELAAVGSEPVRSPIADPAAVALQDEPISGVVVDVESRAPVPRYALEIQTAEGESELVWTDDAGHFATERGYAPGNYIVTHVDHPDLAFTGEGAGMAPGMSSAIAAGLRWDPEQAPVQVPASLGPTYPLAIEATADWSGLTAWLRAAPAPGPSFWEPQPTLLSWRAPVRPIHVGHTGETPWVRFQRTEWMADDPAWLLQLVSSDGLLAGEVEVASGAGMYPETVTIALEPRAKLALTLVAVDPLREPVVTLAALAALADGTRRRMHAQGHSVRDDGRNAYHFELSALPGGDFRVLVASEGEEHEHASVSLTTGEVLVRELELAGGPQIAHVRGELRSVSGTFHEQMNVQLLAEGAHFTEFPEWTRVDDRWVAPFELANVPAGEYQVLLGSERSNQRWTPFPWRVVAPADDLVLTCQDTEPVQDMIVSLRKAEPGGGLPTASVELVGCAVPSMGMAAGGAGGSMRMMYSAVPVDAELTCYAWAEGCAPFLGDETAIVRDGAFLMIDVLLEPGWGARIQTSLADVEVRVDGTPAGTTDSSGELVLSLPAAPERVDLGRAGYRYEGGDWDPDTGRLTGRFGTHVLRFVADA